MTNSNSEKECWCKSDTIEKEKHFECNEVSVVKLILPYISMNDFLYEQLNVISVTRVSYFI